MPIIVQIGKLQLLRKLVLQEIYFSAKVESPYYTACLEALNQTTLHNLDEMRDSARRHFVEREEDKMFEGLLGNESMN